MPLKTKPLEKTNDTFLSSIASIFYLLQFVVITGEDQLLRVYLVNVVSELQGRIQRGAKGARAPLRFGE